MQLPEVGKLLQWTFKSTLKKKAVAWYVRSRNMASNEQSINPDFNGGGDQTSALPAIKHMKIRRVSHEKSDVSMSSPLISTTTLKNTKIYLSFFIDWVTFVITPVNWSRGCSDPAWTWAGWFGQRFRVFEWANAVFHFVFQFRKDGM